MPAPAKTSDEAIVRAARRAIERQGPAFSMAAVAEAVGVQPPSLYKRFRDRDALVARVVAEALAALGAAIARAAGATTGRERVRAMAQAYVRFAYAQPHVYALLFSADSADEVQAARLTAVAPVLAALRELAGDDALNAARTMTAFLHGHVSMALAGAFHLGGSVDEALSYGIDRVLDGICAARSASSRS